MSEQTGALAPSSPLHQNNRLRRFLAPRGPREDRIGYLFLTPWFIGMVVFTIGPILASLYLSFTEYTLLKPPEWLGLANLRQMLEDPRLHKSLRVTFHYVFVSVPLSWSLALGAGAAAQPGRARAALLPVGATTCRRCSAAASPSRSCGGRSSARRPGQPVPRAGRHRGRELGLRPGLRARHADLLHVWTFGAPMVIFLAGLRQIPTMYYEAAAVDGAGAVRAVLPHHAAAADADHLLQPGAADDRRVPGFTQAFVVSGGTGGPADSTLLYTLYLYQQGFGDFDMGYASAHGLDAPAHHRRVDRAQLPASPSDWVFYDD